MNYPWYLFQLILAVLSGYCVRCDGGLEKYVGLIRKANGVISNGLTAEGLLKLDAKNEALQLVEQSLTEASSHGYSLQMIPALELAVDLLVGESEGKVARFENTGSIVHSVCADGTITHILHIPKNAGTSLSDTVKLCPSGCALFHEHSVLLQHLSNKNVLALIRDPVSRFVSSFVFYKQGGYRGSHKRLSNQFATQSAHKALKYQNEIVDILKQELVAIDIQETRSKDTLYKKLAQVLNRLSYLTWAIKGQPAKAYESLTAAAEILASLNVDMDKDMQVRLNLLKQTLSHPIHKFESISNFVQGLKDGNIEAWRAMNCQENMINSDNGCDVGSKNPMELHLAFRSQIAWLQGGTDTHLQLVAFEDFTACASEPNATMRECLGIPCTSPIPHMNGRARLDSDTHTKSLTSLSSELKDWIRSMYSSDFALHSCIHSSPTRLPSREVSEHCLLQSRLLLEQPQQKATLLSLSIDDDPGVAWV